jgi:hypothetical protein
MNIRERLRRIAAITERLDRTLAEVERAEFQSACLNPGESDRQAQLVAKHAIAGGRKSRAVLQAAMFLVSSMLVGWVIPPFYVNHSRGAYCDRCGMLKGEHSTTRFGLTLWASESQRETTFQRLYRRYVSTDCRHQE